MGGAYLQPPARLSEELSDDQPVFVLVTRSRERRLRRLMDQALVPLYADHHSMLLRSAG
jgi:hypothetical protein